MLLLFADLVLLYIFVDAFLRGRFANWVVGFLDRVVFRDYNRALDLYQQVFRNYMEWFMAFAFFCFYFFGASFLGDCRGFGLRSFFALTTPKRWGLVLLSISQTVRFIIRIA